MRLKLGNNTNTASNNCHLSDGTNKRVIDAILHTLQPSIVSLLRVTRAAFIATTNNNSNESASSSTTFGVPAATVEVAAAALVEALSIHGSIFTVMGHDDDSTTSSEEDDKNTRNACVVADTLLSFPHGHITAFMIHVAGAMRSDNDGDEDLSSLLEMLECTALLFIHAVALMAADDLLSLLGLGDINSSGKSAVLSFESLSDQVREGPQQRPVVDLILPALGSISSAQLQCKSVLGTYFGASESELLDREQRVRRACSQLCALAHKQRRHTLLDYEGNCAYSSVTQESSALLRSASRRHISTQQVVQCDDSTHDTGIDGDSIMTTTTNNNNLYSGVLLCECFPTVSEEKSLSVYLRKPADSVNDEMSEDYSRRSLKRRRPSHAIDCAYDGTLCGITRSEWRRVPDVLAAPERTSTGFSDAVHLDDLLDSSCDFAEDEEDTHEALAEVGGVLAAVDAVFTGRMMIDNSSWRYGRNRVSVVATSVIAMEHDAADHQADDLGGTACITPVAQFMHETGFLHNAQGETYTLEAEADRRW